MLAGVVAVVGLLQQLEARRDEIGDLRKHGGGALLPIAFDEMQVADIENDERDETVT
jgi:hypothetical protein